MYWPVYLLMVATVLVMVQPVCMLVIGSWKCDGNFSADQLDAYKVTTENGHFFTKSGSTAGQYNSMGIFQPTAGNEDVIAFRRDTPYVDGCSPSMQNFFFDGGQSNA